MVAPAALSFVGIAPGSHLDLHLLVSNDSMVVCDVSRIAVTLGGTVFSVISPPALPDSLAPGSSVTLTVRYAPTMQVATMDTGTLEIDAGSLAKQVRLTGTTVRPAGCHLQPTPNLLSFGVVSPGVQKTLSTVLTNVSSASCNVSAISLAPGTSSAFSNPTQALGAIAPGASVTISVTYDSVGSGQATGTLRIVSNDTTTPTLDIPLSATTPPPGICVNPTLLSYGMVSGSKNLTFTITACGGRSVTVTGLPFNPGDPEFSLVTPPPLPLILAAGALQTITVRYAPTMTTPASATIDVVSNDPVTPNIPVTLEGGGEIQPPDSGIVDTGPPDAGVRDSGTPDVGPADTGIPPAAGKYLYTWSTVIAGAGLAGDVNRTDLRTGVRAPYWGYSTGNGCVGCHTLSPDGRYLALSVYTGGGHHQPLFALEVIDTMTGVQQSLPFAANSFILSWRPNVNTTPPYQFAFDDTRNVWIASLTGGVIGALNGASNPSFIQKMPSWGPNGQIAFVRGTADAPIQLPNAYLGFGGTSDIMLVPETGGTAVPLAGASGNGVLNYYPAFSPDGKWIAFTQAPSTSINGSYAAAGSQLRGAAASNSGQVLMLPNANGTTGGSFPTWSVDGTLLSFSSPAARGGAGDWDIWYVPFNTVTGADGAAINLSVANTNQFDHIARWSP
jgi:hypothetical protein